MAFFSFMAYTFMAVFPILNPIGMAPVFQAMTESFSPDTRHSLAKTVSIYCFVLMTLTLLVGGIILHFFGISIPVVRIAGGLVIFHSAWEMLNSQPKLSEDETNETMVRASDIAFFPLTMPITAGAGTIAVILSVGASCGHVPDLLTVMNYISAIGAIFFLAVTVFISYRYADNIFNRLGKVGTNVFTKMSAFILLTIGVQIIWEGISKLISM